MSYRNPPRCPLCFFPRVDSGCPLPSSVRFGLWAGGGRSREQQCDVCVCPHVCSEAGGYMSYTSSFSDLSWGLCFCGTTNGDRGCHLHCTCTSDLRPLNTAGSDAISFRFSSRVSRWCEFGGMFGCDVFLFVQLRVRHPILLGGEALKRFLSCWLWFFFTGGVAMGFIILAAI